MALILVVLCIWIACPVVCYRCPPPALKTIHASNICNDLSYYHCLWNTLIDDYNDVCLKPEATYTPGSYVVYSDALNARRCPPDRYQPFAFSTNELNECVYQKSNCTEEGQIPAAGGTYTEDATCKCDFTKGYSYITRPKNPCNCKPAKEDCSCYLTQCLNGTHKLSPDYNCEVIDVDIIRQYQCPRIKPKTEKENGHHKNRNNSTRNDYKDNVVRQSVDTFFVARIVTVLVLLMIVAFIATLIFAALMCNERDDPEFQALLDRSYRRYKNVKGEGIFTDITTFKHAKKMTQNNRVIILKGRKGSGKTTLAMYLASVYIKQNYKLAVLGREDRESITEIQRSSEKFVIILEEWFDTSHTDSEAIKLHSDMFDCNNFQNDFAVIVTASHLSKNMLEQLREDGIMTGNNVVNLDEHSPERIEDNQSILRCMLSKYNRALTDETIVEAAETRTYYGFPLQCVLFCQEDSNFELGAKFLRQPPRSLIDIVNELKSSGKPQDRIMYCVLVYILLEHETGLPINDFEIANINNISKKVFDTTLKSISENGVKTACEELDSKCLLVTRKSVYFLHPVVYQAVMLLYAEVGFKQIIEKCDLVQILDIVRPLTYEKLEGEVILIIDRKKTDSAIDILAKRMAFACILDDIIIPRIVAYVRKCKFAHVLEKIMNHLETQLKKLITDKRIDNITILMRDLTSNDCLEILEYSPTNFVLTWTLIALQKSGQHELIQTLTDRYIIRGNRQTAVGILRTVVDEYENSFLHYCILWWCYKDNPFMKYLGIQFQKHFDEWVKYTEKNFEILNDQKMSAVDVAAYFGNHELLNIFIRLKLKMAATQSFPAGKIAKVSKEVERLLNYVENGKTSNAIHSDFSCPFINMTVCGPIYVDDTFDYDKTAAVLTSLKIVKQKS